MAAKKTPADALEHVEVRSRGELRAWLEEHHTQRESIWLVTYKKATPDKYVGYEAVVEELLCFGWIDSRAGTVDERRSKLLCAPRREKSAWSAPNKERVARLEAAGLMRPAGRALVELAQRTGSWDALAAVDALEEPPELIRRLAATPDARRHWDAFPRSAKRAILDWIRTAKKAETRARRIEEAARLAAKNERANEWRPKEEAPRRSGLAKGAGSVPARGSVGRRRSDPGRS